MSYKHLYYLEHLDDIHSNLVTSVSTLDVHAVESLLKMGADPNTGAVNSRFNPKGHIVLYNADGTLNRDGQCSAVECAVFRLSDCMLTHADRMTLVQIQSILLRYGADAAPALTLFHERYGTPPQGTPPQEDREDDSTAFFAMYDLLAQRT